MQINHNIRAMVTQHSLYSNNTSMSKSLEKLSTGLRINRAQDDSAGLAMSEQMRTQIRGLGKAKQNSQDSIAALQIAEGGLAEITNCMQRQRELAVQSANDTLTSTERKYLNDEFQELTNEVARISKTTDYNGKNMLNWDEDPNKSFGAVGSRASVYEALTAEYKTLNEDIFERVSTTTNTGSPLDVVRVGATAAIAALKAFNDLVNTSDTGTDISNVAGGLTDFQNAVTTFKGLLDTAKASDEVSIKDKETLNTIYERLKKVSDSSSTKSPIDSLGEIAVKAVKVDSSSASSYTLHIGANYSFGIGGKWGNEMTVTYISLNPGALGIAQRDIKTQNNATDALDQLDKVIKSVSGARAKIGTFINRLEYTINNVANLEFNTQDAESRIRDTDFAKETTNFTRNQIMVQSATSMLSQANALPQSVLSLIG
jgi:flagellin